MIPMTLGEIAAAVDGRVQGDADLRVAAVTTDSRELIPGALFVALRGEARDGHDFARAALDRGAAAVLVEGGAAAGAGPAVVVADTWRALGALASAVRHAVDPAVVAVTGSVGKTTTKDLTAAALSAAHATVAARGSFNNELGVPLTLLSLEPGTAALVTELGARRPGDIARLAQLVAPDVAIVTAVAGVHLEVFGDIDAVARTKAELVASLPPGGTAVLNAQDPRVAAMADQVAGRVLRFSTAPSGADVTAHDVDLDRFARARFTADTPWGSARVQLPVSGRHHVANALAALAAAGACGVDVTGAAAALAGAQVSSWRGEVRDVGGVIVVNDAYNANPTSVRAALETLVDVARPEGGRTVAVLGVMAEIGAAHEREHLDVGRAVVEHAVDELIVVGEAAAPVLAGATSAGLAPDLAHAVDDAAAATDLLGERVEPGDVVLVKASRVAALETIADGLEALLGPEPSRSVGARQREGRR